MFPHIFESEFKWFISGQTNIAELRKANNNIWNNWADENGDLGPVYGHQLRNFNSQGFDQLEGVIKSINDMPDSRRHVISLWNPAQIEEMALPPCYLYFQFFVDKQQFKYVCFNAERRCIFRRALRYSFVCTAIIICCGKNGL